ncbi:MAG: S-layer homology domain-containing protein, partial [Clostridiales bacterium]|nr:S-layer homology domain-containing protein [Clostridiales bacterium]
MKKTTSQIIAPLLALAIALMLAPPLGGHALATGGGHAPAAWGAAAVGAESAMAPFGAASRSALDEAVLAAAANMLKAVKAPQVGSVGGEWAVIGLARSGASLPSGYCEGYGEAVEKYAGGLKGVLHGKKYTEYSRVILGLTAAGYDPRDVAGYDLTAPLADFEKTVWQGINGPIWALIALDSGGYPNPCRDEFIAEILRGQLPDGGWDLAGKAADPDMTGMAIQALARYRERKDVAAAIGRALDIRFSYATSEGVAQMLVARAALGMDTAELVGELQKYGNGDGSYAHVIGGGAGNSQMASEQALYALVAAQRARDGKNSLYDMSDAAKRGGQAATVGGGQAAAGLGDQAGGGSATGDLSIGGTSTGDPATGDHATGGQPPVAELGGHADDGHSPAEAAGLPGKHADVKKIGASGQPAAFGDIDGHPFRTAIEALAARGVINGNGGGFSPEGTVTRAEFAKIAALSLGLPDRPASAFSDVPAGQWYYSAVGTAHHYGIVNG